MVRVLGSFGVSAAQLGWLFGGDFVGLFVSNGIVFAFILGMLFERIESGGCNAY